MACVGANEIDSRLHMQITIANACAKKEGPQKNQYTFNKICWIYFFPFVPKAGLYCKSHMQTHATFNLYRDLQWSLFYSVFLKVSKVLVSGPSVFLVFLS